MGRNVNMYEDLKIGVLELQGDFAEHSAMLTRLGAHVVPIRSVEVRAAFVESCFDRTIEALWYIG